MFSPTRLFTKVETTSVQNIIASNIFREKLLMGWNGGGGGDNPHPPDIQSLKKPRRNKANGERLACKILLKESDKYVNGVALIIFSSSRNS